MATSSPLLNKTTGWWRSGEPWIWLNATAVALCLLAVCYVLGLIAWRGFAHFWPSDVTQLTIDSDGRSREVIGEIVQRETLSRRQFVEASGRNDAGLPTEIERWLIKRGNRRIAPPDFEWINVHEIREQRWPKDLWVFERREWGNAYGSLVSVQQGPAQTDEPETIPEMARRAMQRVAKLRVELAALEAGELSRLTSALEALGQTTGASGSPAEVGTPQDLSSDQIQRQARLRAQLRSVRKRAEKLRAEIDAPYFELVLANNQRAVLPVREVVRAWQPNRFSLSDKVKHYAASLLYFLSEEPREANTEGGIFPAIFGTVLMVLLMAVLVTPFGVIAAIYLHEYARQGPFVQLIRIAVNNLAGVPSIVYGVFGLGFFVYFLGGNLDRLFFPDALPSPTFGTPGLLWASLTLALLTVPVVIVATEEGLSRIPRSVREGSLALGATRAETLFRIVLPIASPSILTGVILAVARAAGEVAPLMLVGVVKLAPNLPLDGTFPYLHLERKFMHLGFHIYDVGFQSPNVEAARPLVFATALLLVAIVLALNLFAILLRSRLEMRYRDRDE